MKVAVSVPDPVFDAAERLAKERRVPRSQVFSEALEEYVAKHDASAVTAKLNAVYAREVSAVEPTLMVAQYAALSHPDANPLRGFAPVTSSVGCRV